MRTPRGRGVTRPRSPESTPLAALGARGFRAPFEKGSLRVSNGIGRHEARWKLMPQAMNLLAASSADRAAVNSMRRKSPDNCKNMLARAKWLDAILSFSAAAAS
jgi:hypothetical protein